GESGDGAAVVRLPCSSQAARPGVGDGPAAAASAAGRVLAGRALGTSVVPVGRRVGGGVTGRRGCHRPLGRAFGRGRAEPRSRLVLLAAGVLAVEGGDRVRRLAALSAEPRRGAVARARDLAGGHREGARGATPDRG